MRIQTQHIGLDHCPRVSPETTGNHRVDSGLELDLFLPHYLPPARPAGRVPALRLSTEPEELWQQPGTPEPAITRFGKTHVVAGWEMAELIDDRGEVIVILPVREL